MCQVWCLATYLVELSISMETLITSFIGGLCACTIWKFLHPPKPLRIGHGWDLHVLKSPGKPLVLGGVEISTNFQVQAHSDGDVVLHALTDAILGAGGFEDIGQLFPDNDPKWVNASSSIFLKHAISLLSKSGWKLLSVDVTIMLEQPKLKLLKREISRSVTEIIGINCNVKAKTSEGVDAVGRGEAVAACAVVLIVKV